MPSEVAAKADFSIVRYAQVWEDADVLLDALDIRPGHVVLSIASAGDNALALLSKGPARVIALDLNPAQLACLELRVAAYRQLSHPELLELVGSRSSARRVELYRRCRPCLSEEFQRFWDAKTDDITRGIGAIGKFEHYFEMFRTRALPLVHSKKRIAQLLQGGDLPQRREFYETHWNNHRWRWLFQVFFSRLVMGHLGRDPSFFNYVEGNVADRLLERTRYALTELNPAENPYLQWILTGTHTSALPYALRPEHFESIRSHLDRLEWRCQSLEDFLEENGDIDRFNLSDIFEYMSEENYHRLLDKLAAAGPAGARLAYWNMLVPRRRPEALADRLRPLDALAKRLHAQDKAFFYSDFVVEEVVRD